MPAYSRERELRKERARHARHEQVIKLGTATVVRFWSSRSFAAWEHRFHRADRQRPGRPCRHRGGTLRVGSAFFSPAAPISELAYDGLLGYRRVGGTPGARLVGALAAAVPAPTDGGRRYRFGLRRSMRYSNGAAVRAGDFRGIASIVALLVMLGFALSLSAALAPAQTGGLAYSIEFARDITPRAVVDLEQAIDDARLRRAKVVIVRLNTPGGLVDSAREMVATIAKAPMPVIVYVYPSGSRAGSAGVYLTLAADVAAMAPATNIGSATPVRIGGPPARSASEEQLLADLRRKALNDSAAFARTLAESHGHNADLAERMVRAAENVSASEALKAKLIDVVAADERALLRALDGFTITGTKARRLRTQGLRIEHFDAPIASRGDGEDFDNFSTLRFLASIAAVPLLIALTVIGYGRRRRTLNRRQIRRHRDRLARRRASDSKSTDDDRG